MMIAAPPKTGAGRPSHFGVILDYVYLCRAFVAARAQTRGQGVAERSVPSTRRYSRPRADDKSSSVDPVFTRGVLFFVFFFFFFVFFFFFMGFLFFCCFFCYLHAEENYGKPFIRSPTQSVVKAHRRTRAVYPTPPPPAPVHFLCPEAKRQLVRGSYMPRERCSYGVCPQDNVRRWRQARETYSQRNVVENNRKSPGKFIRPPFRGEATIFMCCIYALAPEPCD